MNSSPYSPEVSTVDSTPVLTGNPARDLAKSANIQIILFLLIHLPLALLMELSPWFSTIYATIVVLFGLRAAILRRAHLVIYSIAYIASCEVLWRMSRAHLVWEYAKYAIVLIVLFALLAEWQQRGNFRRIRTVVPIFILALLTPGVVLTVLELGIVEGRDPISFNLAAYLVIIMAALYLWDRPVSQTQTVRILLAIMAPAVGITFLAIYYTFRSLETLEFVAASNWITSGSYGPNQVSNIMGLGALAGTMLLVLMPRNQGAKLLILIATITMLVQGLLTFSRGGIYSFVLALAFFGFHLLSNGRARRRFVLLFAVVSVALIVGLYPMVDDFTGGVLSERFSDTDTTARLELAQIDIQVFLENPFVGVGVGKVDDYHEAYFGSVLSTHTEFTRLFAEHGLLGIITLLFLLWMLFKRYIANPPGPSRAISTAFAVWSMSIMVHSAMRLAAIPLILALALVAWQFSSLGTEQPAAVLPEPNAGSSVSR
jgi:O-antigen ligase